jgi:hypothetical protein
MFADRLAVFSEEREVSELTIDSLVERLRVVLQNFICFFCHERVKMIYMINIYHGL